MITSLVDGSAVIAVLAIPGNVIWAYVAFGVVVAIGLAAIFVRGDWQKARGVERLILFGPVFYARRWRPSAPNTSQSPKASPRSSPRGYGAHVLGVLRRRLPRVAAALSLVTGVQTRLAAALLGVLFLLFVVLMDAPAWAQDPSNRFSAALMLRQLAFSGGALALATSWQASTRERAGAAPRPRDHRALLRRGPVLFIASSSSCTGATSRVSRWIA